MRPRQRRFAGTYLSYVSGGIASSFQPFAIEQMGRPQCDNPECREIAQGVVTVASVKAHSCARPDCYRTVALAAHRHLGHPVGSRKAVTPVAFALPAAFTGSIGR